MTLGVHDLVLPDLIPEVPHTMPVAVSELPCGKNYTDSVRAVGELIGLRDALHVDTPFGFAFATRAGQVEYFAASGAVRARNLDLINRYENERREWAGVDRIESPGGARYAPSPELSSSLLTRSRDLLQAVGLGSAEDASTADVVFNQWARLDSEGTELESGPGTATVRFGYAAEGYPLIGAGAKTHFHFDHAEGVPEPSRMFSVRRPISVIRSVETDGLEWVLEQLCSDAFLAEQAELGARVVITSLTVGLLALPADVVQRVTYPALAVDGLVVGVTQGGKGEHDIRFARYVPAVSGERMRTAGFAVAAR